MKSIKEILETYRRGDKLDDDELEQLREKMQQVVDATRDFGDLFVLQYAYAIQVVKNCESFQRARQEQRTIQRSLTRAQRKALQCMDSCGFSSAEFCGVSDSTMRRLVELGLACEPVQGRVRVFDHEYGITQAGRDALKGTGT